MGLKDGFNHWRDRVSPPRAERRAREQGKSEAEIADAVKRAERRKKLLRSGGAGGGSVSG